MNGDCVLADKMYTGRIFCVSCVQNRSERHSSREAEFVMFFPIRVAIARPKAMELNLFGGSNTDRWKGQLKRPQSSRDNKKGTVCHRRYFYKACSPLLLTLDDWQGSER